MKETYINYCLANNLVIRSVERLLHASDWPLMRFGAVPESNIPAMKAIRPNQPTLRHWVCRARVQAGGNLWGDKLTTPDLF